MARRVAYLRAPAVALVVVLAALSGPGSARAADLTCEASAIRATVLSAATLEPVTANHGADSCADRTKTLTGSAAGLPVPLSAGTLAAATSLSGPADAVERQRALAVGGVANLGVASLPTLPIALPSVTLPDALRTVHVDLSALNAVLTQAGGSLDSIVGTVTSTGSGTGTGGSDGTQVCVLGVCTPLTLRAATGLLPDSIDLDVTGAVQGLLPSGLLPNLQLLGVKAATAYAGGQCLNGRPFVDGAAQASGVSVLGQDLPVGAVLDRTLTLIEQATIDPSNADLGLIQLPASLTSLGITLDNTPLLRQAVQQALDALGDVKVLDPTLARIQVTPPTKTRSGDTVTQRGPTVDVTIAGLRVLHAILGEAKAGATNVRCTRAALTPTDVTLQCTKRRLVLVDVLERRRRVALRGVADQQLAGRTVGIRFTATGRVVAHAKVRRDGTFRTTAPLPARALRGTNRARYQARVGVERSLSLKLRRRMILRSIGSRNGKVTIAGRVVPPLGAPVQTIVLKRRISCKRTEVVRRFKPAPDGRFRVTVPAPRGVGAAVYRMSTKVRKNRSNPKLYPTFTLPRAVELHR